MNGKRLLSLLASLALAILLSACTQKNTGDQPNNSNVPQGLNRFLLFPNPVSMNAGGFETNTADYASAYYRAIDPNNNKDTIDKFKAQNQFDTGTGTQQMAVFRDTKDLGYGRRMTGRMNTDGSVAFYVENYNVTPNASGDYASTLNVEAAINRDTRWHVGTNAIEWSTTPCVPGIDPADCVGTVKFAKYYNFSSKDGTRQLAVDLDGNGLKAMPGPCITCHGGRGDPLTPPDVSNNLPRFPLVENSVSRKRGDVQARLHGMNVDSFEYSPDIAGFSKADQQAKLKLFNQWILCTYPLAGAAAGAEDGCRVPAGPNEYQGTAAEMIKSWYGGNGMPSATFADTYLPAGWTSNAAVYNEAVAPFCRTCHILRGTANQSDIDFTTAAKMLGYADRIKAHVFDRGTMPLALIVYNDFWNDPNAPNQLANFINPTLGALTPAQTATDSAGFALKPGRPIASPGPDRMVKTGANATLTGENSLFAGSFNWSMVSGSATIANPNSMITTFNAPTPGSYVVRLTVGNGMQTDSKDITITADNNFPDPSTLKFAQVKNVLQNVVHKGSVKCVDCHKDVATPAPVNTPPIWYTNFDRNGIGGVDPTDDDWFLKALQGRVNLTEIEASPLLRKPSGHHHAGNDPIDVRTPAGLNSYSVLYNWILAGMPAGGVAASAIINGGVNPGAFAFSGAFGGPFTSPSIAMDASTSIGPSGTPLTFGWSIVSQPVGGNAVITNPNTVNPTMTVQNVGDYVLQLQASGGGQQDIAQTKFTVNETPFTTDFTPADGGSGAVTFAGGRGDLTLTSATSVLTTTPPNPVSCSWTVVSGPGVLSRGVGAPGGPTLDGSSSLVSTKACMQFVTIFIFGIPLTIPVNASATLNVSSAALNQNYVVEFTASTVTSHTVTHTIKVAENPPVPSISVTSSTSVAFSNDIFGRPFASVSLSGSSTGIAPFTFVWGIDSAPAGAVVASSVTSGASTSTLTARATGSYTVRLTVTDSQGGVGATTSTFTVAPSRGTTFSTMTGLFSSLGCTGCHATGNPAAADPANNSGTPPSWENVNDVNGKTLWQRVFQRVSSGSPAGSLLLLNPENITNGTNTNGHGGGCRPGFGCDASGSANATTFSNWVLDGAPPGN